MEFSLHSLVYPNFIDGNESARLKFLSSKGYKYIELIPVEINSINFIDLKKKADEHGIIINLGWSLGKEHNLISKNKAVRQAGIDFMKRLIDIGELLESKTITGLNYAGCGCLTGRPPSKKEFEYAVEAYKDICSYAEKTNINICIEPAIRSDSHLINTADQAVCFIKHIGYKNVKICLDTFQLIREETSLIKAIRAAAKYLGNIHASENNRGIPGSGLFEWKLFFSELKKIGYSNCITVESFFDPHSKISKRSMTWRTLANSPDEVAINSINFLKSLCK